MTRRGFTLVELLIGLIMLALLAGVATMMVTATARAAGHATHALLVDRTVQALQTFLQQELRDAGDTDVTAIAATRVSLARPVGDADVCAKSDSSIAVAAAGWAGTRLPQAFRDEAWMLVDPLAADWRMSAITGVWSDRCADGLTPAIALGLAVSPAAASAVRVMEPVELSAYRSGVADWLGLTPASHGSPVQPFAGPLTPGSTRFARYPGYLAATVQPDRAPTINVHTPLGGP